MSEKKAHPVQLPRALSQSIGDTAYRLDRSLSWCVQRAWDYAGKSIADKRDDADAAYHALAGTDPKQVAHTFFFPVTMLAAIESEAERCGESFSWAIQRAWALAHKEL